MRAKGKWQVVFRLLRGGVYVHLGVCATAMLVLTTAGGPPPPGIAGLGAADAIIVWTMEHPEAIAGCLLAFDVVALYVLHSKHAARRRAALWLYAVGLLAACCTHIAIAAVATIKGVIYGTNATFVYEGTDILAMVATSDLVLGCPLALTLVAVRLRSLRSAGACPACGYDLAGIAAERCPECGAQTPGAGG